MGNWLSVSGLPDDAHLPADPCGLVDASFLSSIQPEGAPANGDKTPLVVDDRHTGQIKEATISCIFPSMTASYTYYQDADTLHANPAWTSCTTEGQLPPPAPAKIACASTKDNSVIVMVADDHHVLIVIGRANPDATEQVFASGASALYTRWNPTE